MLPAGPLREPWPRPVDWVLYAGDTPPPPAATGGNKGGSKAPAFAIHRRLADHAVAADGTAVALSTLRGRPLHAVAAIGQPGAFFAMLEEAGLTLAQAEALPDHYDFDSWLRLSSNAEVLICTEKDAVKLWKKHPDALAVPLELALDARFLQGLKDQLLALAAPLSSTTPPAR